jgi:hypothetical protein
MSVEKSTNAERDPAALTCAKATGIMPIAALGAAVIELHKTIWDVSAFYFVPVYRWIRSTRIGMRRRWSAHGARAHSFVERIVDHHKCGRLGDSELDFHQRNVVRCCRSLERFRVDQRHAKYGLTQ